jgi:hypothetical protein
MTSLRVPHRVAVLLLVSMLVVTGLSVFAWAKGSPRTFRQIWGRLYQPLETRPAAELLKKKPTPSPDTMHRLQHWNEVAINTSGLDHTPLAPGETRVFGEQLGPGRASRAMAIVHLAMFEAMNAIDRRFESYLDMKPAHPGTSMDAAMAQAAHDTLVALFPSQAAHCDEMLEEDLQTMEEGRPKRDGIALGAKAAAAILKRRANDGSDHDEPLLGTDFFPSDQPGFWRQDPIGQSPVALGAYWGDVKPFVIKSGSQFRVPPPPAMTSAEYLAAYNEVKRLGGDDVVTKTERTDDQSVAAIYWAYDGTPSLCAPPRLYNQIAMQIADQMGSDVMETARVLVLVNVAMADAGVAIWESKYFYQLWRPVTGIRESDPGTGPTGLGDGNPATVGDPTFSPLGAPASNVTGPNFTPPFPSYPSGHAGFGGAIFEMLRNIYGTDDIPFTFVSDELNGVTRDSHGIIRPLIPRSFSSLSQAEEENGQSRIYLGIHWSFDKTEGIAQGRKIADYVFKHAFTPKH